MDKLACVRSSTIDPPTRIAHRLLQSCRLPVGSMDAPAQALRTHPQQGKRVEEKSNGEIVGAPNGQTVHPQDASTPEQTGGAPLAATNGAPGGRRLQAA